MDTEKKAYNEDKKFDENGVEYPSDTESQVYDAKSPGQLQRKLKNRHIAMISIGGVIGTGLFLGTAGSLQSAGPVGLLLGYASVGTVAYAVMVSVGEMVSYLPIPGGHIALAARFVNPAFSFTMGWNYWYNWAVVLPAELSAASVLINYWNKTVNDAAWISICLVVVVVINMLGSGIYGECEFVFASIKVITITGLIILGIVLDLGGGPSHDRIGFRYWKHPGPFVQFAGLPGSTGRFLGTWSVMIQAAFSYIGTEIVAIAAGEARNPRRNIPKAISRVYVRILLFYVGGVTIIGLLVPYTDPGLNLKRQDAGKSPFVIAIQHAGIKGLPSVINAAVLTAAWSAASSDLYTSSRALYGLARVGNAPAIFARTSRSGLPYISILACSSLSLFAYMGIKATPGKVFGWFANMTSMAGLLSWFCICVTYLRFYKGMKVQRMDRTKLPYYSRLQPFAAWYGAIFCFLICFFSGWSVFLKDNWDSASFVTTYLPLMLFPVLYTGASIWKKTPFVKPEDMDFITGIAEIEADCYDEPPPKNAIEKFWLWLM